MNTNEQRDPVLNALEAIACAAAGSACAAEEDGTDVFMAMSNALNVMPSTALINAQLHAVASAAWDAEEQAKDDWSGVYEAIGTAYRVIAVETARAELSRFTAQRIEVALTA